MFHHKANILAPLGNLPAYLLLNIPALSGMSFLSHLEKAHLVIFETQLMSLFLKQAQWAFFLVFLEVPRGYCYNNTFHNVLFIVSPSRPYSLEAGINVLFSFESPSSPNT